MKPRDSKQQIQEKVDQLALITQATRESLIELAHNNGVNLDIKEEVKPSYNLSPLALELYCVEKAAVVNHKIVIALLEGI